VGNRPKRAAFEGVAGTVGCVGGDGRSCAGGEKRFGGGRGALCPGGRVTKKPDLSEELYKQKSPSTSTVAIKKESVGGGRTGHDPQFSVKMDWVQRGGGSRDKHRGKKEGCTGKNAGRMPPVETLNCPKQNWGTGKKALGGCVISKSGEVKQKIGSGPK